jgi:hypothetical protein
LLDQARKGRFGPGLGDWQHQNAGAPPLLDAEGRGRAARGR